MATIVLDAGHNTSGQDTGAEGNGLREQDVTLTICQQLKPLLEYNGFNVIMTRDGDSVNGPSTALMDSLQTRVNIANNANADLFVSVHINAFNGTATGGEVLIAGTGGKAEIAANKVLYYLQQVTNWPNRGVKVRNIYVLIHTSMPAILTENGFIDSISDSAKLKDPAFIKSLAVAHAKGICDYFGLSYKEQPQSVPVAPVVTDKEAKAIVLFEQGLKILKGID